MYLERLIEKLPEEKGIRFDEFKSFCQFLNTLDDFGIAMRMYTLAEQPISQGEDGYIDGSKLLQMLRHRGHEMVKGQKLNGEFWEGDRITERSRSKLYNTTVVNQTSSQMPL